MSDDAQTSPPSAWSPETGTSRASASWQEYLAGRRIAVAGLPPPPPSPVRGQGGLLLRGFFFLLALAVAIGIGYLIGRVSGRWWVGGIVFAIIAWVALLLGIGMVGAMKVAREDRVRRFNRALEDPIGRLLPQRVLGRRARRLLDPTAYEALLALNPRPVLVLDLALTETLGRADAIGELAPRGRMPEPEMLDITNRVKGTSLGAIFLLVQTNQMWLPLARSLLTGAPLPWYQYGGFIIFGIAIWMIVRDPLVHRLFGFVGWRRQESVIGAGWIRDDRGEIWTVDDSVVLVTMQGAGVEVQLVKPGKVRSFYLSSGASLTGTRLRADIRAARQRAGSAATIGDLARGAARSVGIERSPDAADQMPTSKQPLRLLLSSWTYPEPRTDLAMRD